MEEAAEEIESLSRIEKPVEVALFGQVADAGLGGDIARRLAEDRDVALSRVQQAQEQLDGGRFARAVGPEEAEHFAAADLKIDVVHGPRLGPTPEVFEHLGQTRGPDDDVVAGVLSGRSAGRGGRVHEA